MEIQIQKQGQQVFQTPEDWTSFQILRLRPNDVIDVCACKSELMGRGFVFCNSQTTFF